MCRRVRSRAAIVWCLLILCGLCFAGTGHGATLPFRSFIPTAESSRSPQRVQPPGADVVALINEHRRAAGCGDVSVDNALASAAQRHADDMAANNFVSHTGSDGSSFGQRARAAGYAYFPSGEIIAAGYATPAAVVEGWINSPGHRAIILNCRSTDIGVAMAERAGTVYRYYWTAVFGQR